MGSPNASDQQQKEQCSPPPAPAPEKDAGIIPPIKSPLLQGLDDITPETVDIFTLDPVAALKLLCSSIETLVAWTGDVPPTPPIRSRNASPATRNHTRTPTKPSTPATTRKDSFGIAIPGARDPSHEKIDGVPFTTQTLASPEAHPHEPVSVIVGANAQPIHIQHGVLARKFYSKRPPPISLEDYLMRMHKYCPMSTAVYLATSFYITRLALIDKIVPVTPRNVHRLLLAGLRVAMKALEDLSWPHSRFSKVGGVTEVELGRLEITFCFLMDFTLKVDEKMLQHEAETLCRAMASSALLDGPASPSSMDLKLPESGRYGSRHAEKRKASSNLPSRPAIHPAGIEVVGQS